MRSKLITLVPMLAIVACSPTSKALEAHPATLTCPPAWKAPAELLKRPVVTDFLPNS